MAKYCKICGKPIYGKARKYCPSCKKKEHLEQMAKYYRDHQDRWQFGGLYWEKLMEASKGSGSLGPHSTLDWDLELKKIEKELQNLGLRHKNINWRYK